MKISMKSVNCKNKNDQTSKSKNKENKKRYISSVTVEIYPFSANIFAKVFHLKCISLSLDEHVILI